MKSRIKVLVNGSSASFLKTVPQLMSGLCVECLVASEHEGGNALLSYHTCAALVTEVRGHEIGGRNDLAHLRAAKSANPSLRVIILRSEAEPEDGALTQFITGNRNVVILSKEQSAKLLPTFLQQIIGANAATEETDFVLQHLIPIEEHLNREGVVTSHFQPIVNLQTLEINAFEALARSQAEGLLNNPGLLFEYAANKNMFAAADYACTEAALRESEGLFDEQMLFLNVQPRSLSDVNFPEILEFKVEKYGRRASEVCVELTEQEGVKNSRLFETALIQFRDRGFRIAVDDFGEGNANFELLMQVNPDIVKMSGKIVSEIEHRSSARKILKSLTSLCDDLGIGTVAEFIENQTQQEMLTEFGVTFGQGWHLGKPRARADFAVKKDLVAPVRNG